MCLIQTIGEIMVYVVEDVHRKDQDLQRLFGNERLKVVDGAMLMDTITSWMNDERSSQESRALAALYLHEVMGHRFPTPELEKIFSNVLQGVEEQVGDMWDVSEHTLERVRNVYITCREYSDRMSKLSPMRLI